MACQLGLKTEKIFSTLDGTNPTRKRQRLSAYADVKEALLRWFQQARANSVAISGPLLTEQARKFADAWIIECVHLYT